MAKAKKPTVAQFSLLNKNGYDGKNWLYIGETIIGADGFGGISKNEDKTIMIKFVNRVTGEEIALEK